MLDLAASRSSINEAVLENGLKAYRAPKKFIISNDNIQLRLEFAHNHRTRTYNYWKKVLFSDESSFELISSSGRTYVRRTREDSFKQKSFQGKQGQGES